MDSFYLQIQVSGGCCEHGYECLCCMEFVIGTLGKKSLKLVRVLNELYILRSIVTFQN